MSQNQAHDFYVDVESRGFTQNHARIQSGQRRLHFNWGDLLWAALTVGRPSLSAVFQFGEHSLHEAIMRLSMIRMALRTQPYGTYPLERTDAFLSLDPTEKAAINYFIGMAVCKMVSERLLQTPWLLHVDVFRSEIPIDFLQGRSRPDLIGQGSNQRDWFVYECKGRTSPPSPQDKEKAKKQARRITAVNGRQCALSIGAFSFFRDSQLEFFWCDPIEEPLKSIEIGNAIVDWRYHFGPTSALLRSVDVDLNSFFTSGHTQKIENIDIEIGLHPKIAPTLHSKNYDEARALLLEMRDELKGTGYHLDGILVKAGPSWAKGH